MIHTNSLSDAEKKRSQRYYNLFNLLNGFSYMCVGETVLILLAVRLECPDHLVSALGAMMFFGFLLLPLGKVITARVGAARCQSLCWIYRNLAALLIASAALFCLFSLRLIGMMALMTGAFFFYGFRAAGVIMSQPLIGDITDNRSRTRLLATSLGLCYFSSLMALVTISILTTLSDSIWLILGIIILGASLGITSSQLIAKIDETEELRKSARNPIWKDLMPAWKNRSFRRLLVAEFAMNLAVIMVIPISILSMKRGYGISDTQALLYSLVQFLASSVMSLVTQPTMDALGARRTMLLTYLGILCCALLWLITPSVPTWWFSSIIFFLMGTANAYVNSSMPCYFLQAVPQNKRVSASVFIAVVTGAGSGIAGMIMSGVLLKLSKHLTDSELHSYQCYFLLTFMALLPGIWTMLNLTRLSDECPVSHPRNDADTKSIHAPYGSASSGSPICRR